MPLEIMDNAANDYREVYNHEEKDVFVTHSIPLSAHIALPLMGQVFASPAFRGCNSLRILFFLTGDESG